MTEKWERNSLKRRPWILFSFFFEGAAFLVFLSKDFKRAFINILTDSKEKKYIIKKQMKISAEIQKLFFFLINWKFWN